MSLRKLWNEQKLKLNKSWQRLAKYSNQKDLSMTSRLALCDGSERDIEEERGSVGQLVSDLHFDDGGLLPTYLVRDGIYKFLHRRSSS